MIAVIADDLTGAAEIAGISLRHGYRVVIETSVRSVDTDVLVIATDSRSMSSEAAGALVRQVTQDLLALQPRLIFKKTDSLLRGHVGEELNAQMSVSGLKRTLLIPANPALKRTIRDSIYYSGDIPLNQSHLADASRNRILTSGVQELVGKQYNTNVISRDEDLPGSGLVIGNTITEADLDHWAGRIDADTIPAGSGGFFNAILKNRSVNGKHRVQEELQIGRNVLYMCGSAFPLSKAYVSEARNEGRLVSYMPEKIFCSGNKSGELMDSWALEIIGGLRLTNHVILAVDELQCDDSSELPNKIKEMIARVVENVMRVVPLDELVIEGGATASSIIEKLGYERFFPVQELSQGVLRMKVQENPGLFLTMKPGSYQWPPTIWNKQ